MYINIIFSPRDISFFRERRIRPPGGGSGSGAGPEGRCECIRSPGLVTPPHTPPLLCVGGGGGEGGGGHICSGFSSEERHYRIVLCTGAFLYAGYSFLLISNKFCDITLLHWKGGRGEESSAVRKIYRTGRVGGQCVRKHYRIVPPNQCRSMRIRILIRVRLKSHKKFNFYISSDCSMPFHRAQKSLDFQDPTPSHLTS